MAPNLPEMRTTTLRGLNKPRSGVNKIKPHKAQLHTPKPVEIRKRIKPFTMVSTKKFGHD